jgi:hypothetical protein
VAKHLGHLPLSELVKVVPVAKERDQVDLISEFFRSVLVLGPMVEVSIIALDSTKSMEGIVRIARLVTSNETRLIGVIEMDDRASCFRPETGFSSATPTQAQNYCALQHLRLPLSLTKEHLPTQSDECCLPLLYTNRARN